jgi:amino acid transporter
MSPAPDDSSAGRQPLGLFDTISIIIGIVIGTTIFYVPWLIFSNVTNPWVGLAVWAGGGLLALIGALCYAEMATTHPRSGGDYVYLTKAFGPWAGFLFGWAQLALVLTASIGVMAYVFGFYAAPLAAEAGLPDLAAKLQLEIGNDVLYAGLAVLFLTLLNILGVTLGKWTQNLLSLAKVVGLLAIVVAGFAYGNPDNLMQAPLPKTTADWIILPTAIILVLYAYGGWNDAAFVAAEVREPRRNIPWALILGTLSIAVIYLLVNAAYVCGLGFEGVQKTRDVPGAVVALTPFAQHGKLAINVLIMVSALGAANGLIFAGARVYATLGADFRLFALLGTWRPGRGAPIVAVLLQAIITLGLLAAMGTRQGHEAINTFLGWFKIEAQDWQASRDTFDTLVSHTAPVFWLFFLMTGFALFILRDKNQGQPRPFSVPLYPILPLIFCNMCLFMLYQSIVYVKERCLFAFGVLGIGFLLYTLASLFGTTPTPSEPPISRRDQTAAVGPSPKRRAW